MYHIVASSPPSICFMHVLIRFQLYSSLKKYWILISSHVYVYVDVFTLQIKAACDSKI